jgi:enediyne biosynthesis protein E11
VAAIDEVLADLGAEGDDLDAIVAGLTDQQWLTPTPAPRWQIAHQIAHLASIDAMTVLAATDPAAFEAHRMATGASFENSDEFIEAGVAEQLAGTPMDVLARWRNQRAAAHDALAAVPPGQKVPWLVTPVSPATMASIQFMELFAHGKDITDALGVVRKPTDRIRHLARFGVRTRDFAFLGRGLTPPAQEFRVELTAPSGEAWEFGPAGAAQWVSGPAADFCLLVTRRRHRDDLALVATGPDADTWLDIAQAYAGPPGPGRAPGQFASAS